MAQDAGIKLRIGILVDSFIQPRWVHRIVQDICRSTFAEIVLVIKNEAEPRTRESLLTKLVARRRHILWGLYTRLDALLFRPDPSSFDYMDITPLVENCPRVLVNPLQKGHVDYFPADDVSQIQSYHLDVAFRFGFRIVKGDALTVARYGIWSYHHGDNFHYRGGPAGFWEMMHNDPTTGSILQILTSGLDSGRVIYRSWSQTHRFSLARNRNRCFWKSANFAMRKLRDLHVGGPSALEEDPTRLELRPYSAPLYTTPNNREMASFLSRVGLENSSSHIDPTLLPRAVVLGLFHRSLGHSRGSFL